MAPARPSRSSASLSHPATEQRTGCSTGTPSPTKVTARGSTSRASWTARPSRNTSTASSPRARTSTDQPTRATRATSPTPSLDRTSRRFSSARVRTAAAGRIMASCAGAWTRCASGTARHPPNGSPPTSRSRTPTRSLNTAPSRERRRRRSPWRPSRSRRSAHLSSSMASRRP